MSKRKDCRNCPIRLSCLGNSQQKTIIDTLAKPLFDAMHQRVNTPDGKILMRLRQSTAEPVIGTLIEYGGMQKLYTKGLKLTNKCMLMAGMAYNLKKLIKQINNHMRKGAGKIGEYARYIIQMRYYHFSPDYSLLYTI